MDTKENKTIKFIIIAVLIIAVISLIGVAFARYITRLNGGATADIAKWSFKVNGKTDENFVINLANTRTGITQEAEVQEGYIGPGTAGAFQLELDATGSEASLEYNISMNVDYSNNQVFPKNLIFYSDSEMQNAMYHTDNNINLNGFIGWNDNSKVHTKTIYWKWDYETGSTQTEKDNNDIADSYWMGKPITLSMNVTAKQVSENPTTGQYNVTFDANGGTLQGYGNASTATKQVTYGEAYGELPVPSREGYTFIGWNGKNKFNEAKYTDLNVYNLKDNTYKVSEIHLKPNTTYKITIKPYNGFNGKGYGNLLLNTKISHIYSEPWTSIAHNTVGRYSSIAKYIYTVGNDGILYIGFDGTQSQLDTIWENNDVQIEEGSTATAYEPYYITQSTEVVQNQNHTLTAIWEPNINSNP